MIEQINQISDVSITSSTQYLQSLTCAARAMSDNKSLRVYTHSLHWY
ncbi:hypothetical protein [Nostoc sp.]